MKGTICDARVKLIPGPGWQVRQSCVDIILR